MSPTRLLVIGGDAAGMSAATHVRRTHGEHVEVVVLERSPFTSYSMCGIPFLVGQEVEDPEDLVVRTPEEFAAQGIAVQTGTEAVAIDASARVVTARDVTTGKDHEERYDHLLYAAGAHPSRIPVPGGDAVGMVVHYLDEGVRLERALTELAIERDQGDHAGRVVVLGTGYIGLELAEALIQRGFAATLVDRSSQVFKVLDEDMAAHVERALRDFGVDVRLEVTVESLRMDGERCQAVVTDAGEIEAELLVIAAGSRPNTEVAETAGCEVGVSGALVVDDRGRTPVEGIWAAGDCVEVVDLVAGQRLNVQLGTHANKQGRIAGIDIASVIGGAEGGDAHFPGVVGTAVTKLCGTEIARTGLTVAEATELGVDHAAISFTGTAKAGYMPDPGEVHVKMVAERGTGRLLGAQLVGSGCAKRIDVAASWLMTGVTVQHAQLFDLSYAPPFGGVWDLLQVGCRKLVAELGLSPRL